MINIDQRVIYDQPIRETLSFTIWVKILAIFIFGITAGGNISVAFLIGSSIKIYKDVLHGAPLPLWTEVVLDLRVLLVLLAFIWPFIGIKALYMKNQTRLSTIFFTLAQGAILLQCSFTIFALAMPFISMGGLQDASESR